MSTQWWRECVFYQIYPRSFADSNGDGIGDLKGILSRLDYLKWLGVGAVWLCPVYDSPNADMGYDIRDYERIMAEFGTMDDFDALLSGLHARGIRLIMDLVINHTSDEHAWFAESRASRDSARRDYYFWRDGCGGAEPNNWASAFTPSAWTYDEQTGQWYLHLFAEKQPDLNWENAAMREEVYGMVNRWFDRGVDGFRLDAISLIDKWPGLPDAAGDGRYVYPSEHVAFQPRLHAHLRELREKCFDGRDCMCVGETTFVTTETAKQLLDDGRELDLLFHFELVDLGCSPTKWDAGEVTAADFRRVMDTWQRAIDWNTLFLGNHDQPRAVSRFGDTSTDTLRVRSAKCFAAAAYLLRGTPFLYQGEELGMTNFPFTSPAQLRDIESLNLFSEAEKDGRADWAWRGILKKGRDHARTPMQWDESENAGFSSGGPWIAVNPNYREVNVRREMADPDSVLLFYRDLIALRAGSDALRQGTYRLLLPDDPQVFAYEREFGGERVRVYCNLSRDAAKCPEAAEGEILLANAPPHDGAMLPYECRVVRVG